MKLLPTPLLLVLLCLAARPASGQCPLFTDEAGGFAAIDSGRAIVGSGFAGPPGVQFYEKTSLGWQPGQSFDAGDLQLFFLPPVAMAGDRAIVGNSESRRQTGQAFVFDLVGDQWQRTELVSATVDFADFFGASVALDGNVAVVGSSHWGPGGGDELGRMHVFESEGGSWSEVAQILPYTTVVDVDGDTIVLGEPASSGYSRVHVYRKVAGLWIWTNRIQVLSSPATPNFGSSVALQGDTLAVGAVSQYASIAGYVRIFRRQGSGWSQVQHIVPSDSAGGDRFGDTVALSGSTLLVGAPHAGNGDPGAIHRYQHDGTSFAEAGSFASDGPHSGFGYQLALYREDALLSNYAGVTFYRLGFAHQSSFCPTTPNSTGSAGSLAVEGCDSLDGQRFTLVASGLPAGVLGVCFFGANTTQVPFGDGFRCVGEPFFRFPSGTADAAGRLVHDVDFSSGPASTITAGRTWHFQAYHRDPASAGAGLNLTNALSIGITP